ncbi:COG3205 Predicted membrane protein [uncultured Caudovirales phage]|uniref:COG3205 Predicted membrane protein n=1 Tax=uncultured Caudovirales phage TaxID=2100421 RepID=A0A6J5L0W1_9CAUD|nr:COG3205 Predicted membrane protein [uncultured Caudovirales phage]CAB5208799.1 COG3205 Predicted membrane protein [uncultured Caudovirales phage]
MSDQPVRSLAKAVSWRVTGTIDTFIISWIITGEPLLASGIAFTEIMTKIALFWFHERAWNKISWGKDPN